MVIYLYHNGELSGIWLAFEGGTGQAFTVFSEVDMIKGIYASGVGMMARQTRQEVISNNLANINTTGFKKDMISFRNVMSADLLLNENPDVQAIEFSKTDFSQAELKKTDNPFDFAINGKGFFKVSDGQNEFYTRAGNFKLNEEYELITAQGMKVVGEGGPIVLEDGEFTALKNGDVAVDDLVVGKLALIDFENPNQLLKIGSNLYQKTEESGPGRGIESQIHQGFLEGSNVSAVDEMINMIVVAREFEQNQKAIQSQDETLSKLLNETTRV